MKSVKICLFSGTLVALCAFAAIAFWPAPQVEAFEGAECDPSTITGPFTANANGISGIDCMWAEQEAIQNLSMNCGAFPNLRCSNWVSASCTSSSSPYFATATGTYYCGQVAR